MRLFVLLLFLSTVNVHAQKSIEGILYMIVPEGMGEAVGSITVNDLKKNGIEIVVVGSNLQAGAHGFHLHEKNMLGPTTNDQGVVVPGGQAGGHWDPDKTGQHLGPEGNGHRGDLPQLIVAKDKMINTTLTNSKIRFKDIKGKSLMIHINPDNYSDSPAPLGGSGGRMYAAPF
ncbi:MAG: superoxide dismutase family protein [Brevinema sp.]